MDDPSASDLVYDERISFLGIFSRPAQVRARRAEKVILQMTINTTPDYEELVEVLARHIHDHWLRDDGLGFETFDHEHSSSQQIAAAVLGKLKILKRIGDGKYSTPLAFDCEPEDFRKRAAENKIRGCAYDTVVMSLIVIMDYGKPEDELLACLMRLGVFELDHDGRYVRTAKYDAYEQLHRNWTTLTA